MNPNASATPTLLVLDTATEVLHLGLAVRGRRLVRALPGGAQASAALLPALGGLIEEAGLGWREIDAIGFGRGPGAFTGVRGACAVAQGLAFGLERPVLAIDTLLAVAEDARAAGAGDAIQVAVDARMGEVYAAAYRCVDGAWQTVAAPTLADPAALAVTVDAGWAIAGNSLNAHVQAWAEWTGARHPDAAPRADALLTLAGAAWARGERLDAAQALPLYVRDKVAQTTAERDLARAAADAEGARR